MAIMSPFLWAQTTIHSTSAGGGWNNTATWVGGTVPASNDHVVIDGKVLVPTGIQCNTLTINDTLVNDGSSCNNRHMTISGDVVNNGVVARAPHYHCNGLQLTLEGDLTNNGVWQSYKTYFAGSASQIISTATNQYLEADGHFINEKTGGLLLAGSDLYLAHKLDLDANTDLDMQGHALHIKGAGQVGNGTITNVMDVYFYNGATLAPFNNPITLQGTDVHFHGKAIYGSSTNGNHTIDGNLTVHDSLVNSGASCSNRNARHLIINGDLTNQGAIVNEPVYYCDGLKIDLSGDLTNSGTFAPYQLFLKGNQTQEITTNAGSSLACTYRMYSEKTGGSLLVNGDFHVNTHFLLNDQVPLNLQGNAVQLGNAANITEGIMNNTDDLYFNGDASLGGNVTFTPGDSLWVRGDTVTVHGHGGLLDKVVLEATVVVRDTLTNKASGTVTATFTEDVINYGSILNETYSYMEFDQTFMGSIYNYGIWEVNNLLFHGSRMRTLRAGDIVYDWSINYDDTLNLVGDNAIQKLSAAIGASNARVHLHPDASLELTKKQAPSDIINEGYVHWQHDIDTSRSGGYDFYQAELRNRAHCQADQIRVKTYGSSVAPGTENTILRYWQITNTPLTYADTLDQLELYYKNADLNGTHPDSLKVFFSDDGGLSWRKLNQNIYHNSSSQYLRVNDVPTVGRYALAGSEVGVSAVRPSLRRIESNTGGQGKMTTFIHGSGLDPSAQPYLHSNDLGVTVQPEAIQISQLGDMIAMEMDLSNQSTGQYDVVVTIPGDTTMTIPNAFTITGKNPPEPFVHLSGREQVMLGRYQTYTITYGNTSNIDARAVPVYLAISEVQGLDVEFLDFNVSISDSSIQQGYAGIDTMPLYIVTDTVLNDMGQVRLYPLYIPRIPANSVNSVRFRIKSNSAVKLQLAMQDPLYRNPFDPACVLGVIGEGTIDIATAAIPGVGCAVAAGKMAFKQADVYLETKEQSWGSWLYDWTITGVDCGINLSGAGGFAKATAMFFTNMYNYKTAFDGCRPDPVRKRDITQVSSGDPNAKVGPSGYGSDNYIAYPEKMPYVIYFENLDTATAPAQTVNVTDTLDGSVYDLNSFQFGGVNFGDEAINLVIGSSHEFERLVDLRPDQNTVLKIEGDYNAATGIIRWDFTSIDPQTGQLTEDPFGGFLPPNDNSPQGEGSVSFFIQPKSGLSDQTAIDNKSTIVFDVNPAITTNTYRNKLDLEAPQTQLNQHQVLNDTTIRLSWSGMDDGAGIQSYTLHVVKNNTTSYAISFRGHATSAQFVGSLDSTYEFSIVAEDSVSNMEALPAQPGLKHTFQAPATSLPDKPEAIQLAIYPNPVQNGQVQISPGDQKIQSMRVEVMSLDGRLLKAARLNQQPYSLDMSGFSSGLYLLRVKVVDQQIVRKVTVQ